MMVFAWLGLFWFATFMCGAHVRYKNYGWAAVNALIALQALAYLIINGGGIA